MYIYMYSDRCWIACENMIRFVYYVHFIIKLKEIKLLMFVQFLFVIVYVKNKERSHIVIETLK